MKNQFGLRNNINFLNFFLLVNIKLYILHYIINIKNHNLLLQNLNFEFK